MLGKNKLEHGIAEKFQALIIEMMFLGLVSKAGVSQCLRKKQRIAKFVVKAFLDGTHETIKRVAHEKIGCSIWVNKIRICLHCYHSGQGEAIFSGFSNGVVAC